MAESYLPEIFPNVKLLVDPERFVEPWTVKKTGIKKQERGSLFEFSGTFKDTDDFFLELSSKEKKSSKYGATEERRKGYEHTSASMKSASSERVEPVEVDSVIMSYIEEKCSAELNKIRRPEVSMQVNKKQVTFHPRDTGHGTVFAQLARERFVIFYQKIATELQSRLYYLDATQLQLLLAKFPELLISTGQRRTDEITLTGRFISLERFEQFINSPSKMSSPRQINHTVDMSATASSHVIQDETSGKEETCSICLEQMVKSQMKTLEKCKHSFCENCLKMAFQIKPVCPTCGVIYGAKGNPA
ncbi:hypothetical protein PHYPO_G00142150 [Pangasianodon hypophthalmus]|uniref:E3 ubiquitin-protein ligase n=1 Tax=Pangasianodon hypophthalmus TaxID=310915 RepID=A0A5N5KE64_PANHP|nr:hypothetical protein PHYPO_G00142150 [Pangasianodon hypophthalmus]